VTETVSARAARTHSLGTGFERARSEAIGWLWATWMRAEAASWRVETVGAEQLDTLERSGARTMVVVWHGCYRAALASVRERPAALLSTNSFRGRIIEAAARHLGHRAVLRPADLRGDAALDWMCDALETARRMVVVADGPDGPARRAKRGVVALAARLGLRIVPCASAGHPAYVRERWDAQELPLPFARVAIVFGEALPPLEDDADESVVRARISNAIDVCRERALARIANGRRLAPPSPGE
jgi:lysophospholipid acyltransferase (LPLAT)-like uncharacterized protein